MYVYEQDRVVEDLLSVVGLDAALSPEPGPPSGTDHGGASSGNEASDRDSAAVGTPSHQNDLTFGSFGAQGVPWLVLGEVLPFLVSDQIQSHDLLGHAGIHRVDNMVPSGRVILSRI